MAQSVLDLHAVAVYRYAGQLHAGLAQQGGGRGVAGVFHPDLVARLEEGAGDQVEAVAIAGGDEDLFGPAIDTA